MVSSISMLPSVGQLLNPLNPVTGKPQTASAQTTGPTTASGNTSTGVLSSANSVSLSPDILSLLQGTGSSSGADPISRLLGGNSGNSAGGSVTSLYTNLLLTAVTSSISGASDNAAAQKSANSQLTTDPLQAVIKAYNNATTTAQISLPSQSTSA